MLKNFLQDFLLFKVTFRILQGLYLYKAEKAIHYLNLRSTAIQRVDTREDFDCKWQVATRITIISSVFPRQE